MSFTRVPHYNERACVSCIYYSEEWEGEYGGYYCGSFCDKKGQEHFGNLKSFPFKKKKDCHILKFWHSRFANLAGEPGSKRDKLSIFFYRKSDSQGNLAPLYESAFQMALKKYCKGGLST